MNRHAEPHGGSLDAAFRQRGGRRFRFAGEGGSGRIGLGRSAARREQRQTRCHQQRTVGAFERRAERLNSPLVLRAVLGKASRQRMPLGGLWRHFLRDGKTSRMLPMRSALKSSSLTGSGLSQGEGAREQAVRKNGQKSLRSDGRRVLVRGRDVFIFAGRSS